MTRRVCASMPSGRGAPSSAGSVGIWPVTKSQPSAAVAWLNGATGFGASAIIRNSIISIPQPAPGLLTWSVHRMGSKNVLDRARPGHPRLTAAATVAQQTWMPGTRQGTGLFWGWRRAWSGGFAAAAFDDLPQCLEADAMAEIA